MKDTLVVNFFAGPGAGKSTSAAYVYSKLSMMGYDCELVQEWTKSKGWEDNKTPFGCDIYIKGKQAYRLYCCKGKVDIVVTDGPLLLGKAYTPPGHLMDAYAEEAAKYKNLNVLVVRKTKWNESVRRQTLEQAMKIDEAALKIVEDDGPYLTAMSNEKSLDGVIERIIELRENMPKHLGNVLSSHADSVD